MRRHRHWCMEDSGKVQRRRPSSEPRLGSKSSVGDPTLFSGPTECTRGQRALDGYCSLEQSLGWITWGRGRADPGESVCIALHLNLGYWEFCISRCILLQDWEMEFAFGMEQDGKMAMVRYQHRSHCFRVFYLMMMKIDSLGEEALGR